MNENIYSDNFDENWDIYDKALRKIGIRKRREVLEDGEFHLVVGVFLFDKDGNVLLQKRSMTKLNNPGQWQESAGGSVLSGETAVNAIQRELEEELGLTTKFSQKDCFFQNINKDWITIWFSKELDFDIKNLVIQELEVDKIVLLKIEDAINYLKSSKLKNILVEASRNI